MNIDPAQILQWISIYALPLLLSVVFHEVAHAYVAEKCGDSTARRAGRITLNPLAHIDLMGTVLLPLFLTITNAPVKFGWAKPVPVNVFNLRKIRRDSVLVALAGPATNLALALVCAVAFALIMTLMPDAVYLAYDETDPAVLRQMGAVESILVPVTLMVNAGLQINMTLMLFNLLPILPLDGGRMLNGMLPDGIAEHYEKLEPYGMLLIICIWIIPATQGAFYNAVSYSTSLLYLISFY